MDNDEQDDDLPVRFRETYDEYWENLRRDDLDAARPFVYVITAAAVISVALVIYAFV